LNDLVLRFATADDLSQIVKIENLTNQTPWTEAQFLSSMEVGHFSLVLLQESALIGFAIYSPLIPESHLLNIAVSPAHQGEGLGRRLLAHTIDQNKAMGVKNLSLEVRVSNVAAIALYQSMGFNKDALRPEYYSGNPREDALLMSLNL